MAPDRYLLVACLVLGATACAARSTPVEYSVSAQTNYERGVKQLVQRDWIVASKYFEFIDCMFPSSKYAPLAELRLADLALGTEHYGAALDAYQRFKQLHPDHEQVANGYVSFKMGEAFALASRRH